MLKNGRILVVMLAAGIAVAAAPPLHAAPVAQANASARRHRDPATTGTVTSVVASKTSKTVTITIGTTVYNVLRSHVRIQNADGKMRHPGTLQDLTPGTAVLVRVVRNSDNSIQRLRLAVFTSLANANTALARFQARHPHH